MKLFKLALISTFIILSFGKQALPGATLMPDSVAYGYATNNNYALQNAAVNKNNIGL